MEPHGLTPVAPSAHLVGRNPPKRILLRQGYGGYHPRIHPRVYTRGFLRRRVKSIETSSSNLVAIFPETYLPRGSKPSGLPPSRRSLFVCRRLPTNKKCPLGVLCASALNKLSNNRRDAEFAENICFAQSGDGDWAKTSSLKGILEGPLGFL